METYKSQQKNTGVRKQSVPEIILRLVAASMPLEVVYGFAYLKKAAAHANCQLGVLAEENGLNIKSM